MCVRGLVVSSPDPAVCADLGGAGLSTSSVISVSKPEAGGVKRPRRSVRTATQGRDEALDRMDVHLQDLAEDPHGDVAAEAAADMAIINELSDPLAQQQDQAQRTHDGQKAWRQRRRAQ